MKQQLNWVGWREMVWSIINRPFPSCLEPLFQNKSWCIVLINFCFWFKIPYSSSLWGTKKGQRNKKSNQKLINSITHNEYAVIRITSVSLLTQKAMFESCMHVKLSPLSYPVFLIFSHPLHKHITWNELYVMPSSSPKLYSVSTRTSPLLK